MHFGGLGELGPWVIGDRDRQRPWPRATCRDWIRSGDRPDERAGEAVALPQISRPD